MPPFSSNLSKYPAENWSIKLMMQQVTVLFCLFKFEVIEISKSAPEEVL
jgi:hypothetical protein